MLGGHDPIALQANPIGTPAALGVDLTGTAGDKVVFVAPFKCLVIGTQLAITQIIVGTTLPVVKFDKRPTCGSDTGRGDGDIGAYTLAAGGLGDAVYDESTAGVVLEPGQEVVFELITPASGGTPTGYCRPTLLVDYAPETPANLSNMVINS